MITCAPPNAERIQQSSTCFTPHCSSRIPLGPREIPVWDPCKTNMPRTPVHRRQGMYSPEAKQSVHTSKYTLKLDYRTTQTVLLVCINMNLLQMIQGKLLISIGEKNADDWEYIQATGTHRCFILLLLLREIISATSFILHPISDRKSTRLNSSHSGESRMPSSA